MPPPQQHTSLSLTVHLAISCHGGNVGQRCGRVCYFPSPTTPHPRLARHVGVSPSLNETLREPTICFISALRTPSPTPGFLQRFHASTGQEDLARYLVVEDCGRMVNPFTATFMDYPLPTATDIPALEVSHIETLPPVTLGGFKGMAEGGTIGATATLANAVADALAPLGITVTELPLSPQRIVGLVAGATAARQTPG